LKQLLEKSLSKFIFPRREELFQGGMMLSPCFVLSTILQGRGFFIFVSGRQPRSE
jgi:hypothetical protein